jgi:hypothetical protein
MRGVWYIIESVIASIVIVGFIVAISAVYITKPYPADMGTKAFDMLDGMDNRGVLRNYTETLNRTGINSEIAVYSYNRTSQICDYAGSCAGSAPDSGNVWSGSYIVAGLSTYQPREVRLYLWPL